MPRIRRPRALLASATLLAAAGLAVGLALSGCVGLGLAPAVDTVGKVAFETPLRVPPLAPSRLDADGTRVFELAAREGRSEFLPGVATPTWGFSQSYLGPTLRAARGETVRVDVRNELDETTTVHWHGMHLPAAMDGGPHQPIAPGTTWSPTWTLDQPAATLWYHPHPHGETEEHVTRGLAGMFIVDDPAEQSLGLPSDYGVDDIPVIVQDVAFDADGELVRRDGGFSGSMGDRLLVDGTLGPYLDVTTDVVRLRLLNAAPARVLRFAFDDAREFVQIASDGGLLPEPVPTTSVQLSPGERAEILVRMSPGESTVLRSERPALGGVVSFGGGNAGAGDRFDVLELRAADALASRGAIPASLPAMERLNPVAAVAERDFVLDDTQINGEEMAMSRIDAVVEAGTTEIWNVTNNMAFQHNFHVHDVQFQILSIAGQDPPPALAGWKDTVYLPPNEEVRLVLRFGDDADPAHPYMFHCHLLRHEDQGMMGQFLVLAPGQEPDPAWSLGGAPGMIDEEAGHEH